MNSILWHLKSRCISYLLLNSWLFEDVAYGIVSSNLYLDCYFIYVKLQLTGFYAELPYSDLADCLLIRFFFFSVESLRFCVCVCKRNLFDTAYKSLKSSIIGYCVSTRSQLVFWSKSMFLWRGSLDIRLPERNSCYFVIISIAFKTRSYSVA
jgi:hypothetical protein